MQLCYLGRAVLLVEACLFCGIDGDVHVRVRVVEVGFPPFVFVPHVVRNSLNGQFFKVNPGAGVNLK